MNGCNAIVRGDLVPREATCGASAPWKSKDGFSYCDEHRPSGTSVVRVLPPANSTLERLEARARELGCDLGDKSAWGERWALALTRKIEDAIWSREKLEIARRRRAAGGGR